MIRCINSTLLILFSFIPFVGACLLTAISAESDGYGGAVPVYLGKLFHMMIASFFYASGVASHILFPLMLLKEDKETMLSYLSRKKRLLVLFVVPFVALCSMIYFFCQ